MKDMLNMAAKFAQGGQDRNYRLGCIAERTDGAIVISRNERTEKPNPSAHAEVRALRKAGKGSTLYVARVNRSKDWTFARPCPRCQAYICSKEVHKVYYTISPGEFGVWYPGRTELPKIKVTRHHNNAVWEEVID